MNRLVVAIVLVLGTTCAARAQDETLQSNQTSGNLAANFANTPAARLAFLPPSATATFQLSNVAGAAGTKSFATPTTSSSFVQPASAWPSSGSAAATPRPQYGSRAGEDLRFELALGISMLRFRSGFYYATAIGTSTSLTYFTHQSFGIEGSIVTAFAPRIYANEHVKYFSYGVGPKLAWRRTRLEPWVHGIVGGAHIIPQTAVGGHNGFLLEVGGGADYSLNPRVSVRLELDWVRAHLFGEWQNNAQAALDGVIHF